MLLTRLEYTFIIFTLFFVTIHSFLTVVKRNSNDCKIYRYNENKFKSVGTLKLAKRMLQDEESALVDIKVIV